MESVDQYKQKGYVQKLKTAIAPDIIHSGYPVLEFLYQQVKYIDGVYFVYSCCVHHLDGQCMAG